MSKYKVGNIVTGCITGIEKYGAFVSLDSYYTGLIHISEFSDGFVSNVSDYVKVGESIKAKVIAVDDEDFHVKLSIKDMKKVIVKKRRKPIVEVGSGFGILEENLDKWILEKAKKTEKKF